MARLTSTDDLRRVIADPRPATRSKILDALDEQSIDFLKRCPFALVGTTAADGTIEVSPKGDEPGFIRVEDPKTLLIPDRRGNNRIDSLRNLVRDPRVTLLFLIPGIGETLRVNGTAAISVDPALIGSFVTEGKAPRSVLVVSVERVYFQCSKAIVRSRLWDPATQIARSAPMSFGGQKAPASG